jgi:hypothetical protein
MPAKSGKDGSNVVKNYQVLVGRMTGPKTRGAVAAVMTTGMTYAKFHAPVEYNVMANSAYQRINETENSFHGECGFENGVTPDGFNYAFWLHETLRWKPRPPNKKAGPAWNPDATPKFLEHGFTSPEQQEMINIIIKDSYK